METSWFRSWFKNHGAHTSYDCIDTLGLHNGNGSVFVGYYDMFGNRVAKSEIWAARGMKRLVLQPTIMLSYSLFFSPITGWVDIRGSKDNKVWFHIQYSQSKSITLYVIAFCFAWLNFQTATSNPL